MTDQIERLFADLRAETLPTVRPPGTAPLRSAVRRRRAALSGAAAIMVLALAGGLALANRPGSDPAPPAAPRSDAPVHDGLTLESRVATALEIDDSDLPEPGEIITNTGYGAQESRRELLGGAYEVRMVCWGSGSMDVTVSSAAVGAAPASVVDTLACDTTGTVRALPIVVPDPGGTLAVRIEPAVAGPGRAAFGWTPRLAQPDRSRWMQAARDALGESRHSIGGGSDFLETHGTGFDHENAEAGRYRVRAVCVGYGSVRLVIGASGVPPLVPADRAELRCSPAPPTPASVSWTTAEGLAYDVEPDPDARGRSAVATVLEKY
jgi:hypothetical protein